jgi:hypothetical protein
VFAIFAYGGPLAQRATVTGDPRAYPHDPLRKRVDSVGNAPRRAEAAQALRGSAWLEALRLRFEFAIEILDVDIEYVFDPVPDPHGSVGLRSALLGGESALRESIATVLSSGKARALTAGDFRIRFVPLFIRSVGSPMPLGVLALGFALGERRRPSADDTSEADRRLELAAQWLVAAIESSLVVSLRRAGDTHDLSRAAGAFDVVDALTQLHTDREIIGLLMDAVALWYDADVYVYHQDLSGTFSMYASLPGAAVERAAPQLLGHQFWGRGDVFSPESHGELEALGWSASMGHTLFVPITIDQSTEWLLAVSGAVDDVSIRQTLGALARVAGALLADLQHQTTDRLARKLASILVFSSAPVHATARTAFEALAAETGASSVLFAAFEVEAGRNRPVLSLRWGGSDDDVVSFVDAETTSLAPQAIAVGVGTGSGLTAVLSLKRDTGTFAPLAQRLVRSAAATIGIWLSGSLLTSRDLREPAADDYGGELVQRLRNQVDRFGHVRVAGAVAVVLPQSQAPEGQSIDEAVDLIEHHVRPSDVIGAVGGTGAGVLLAEATRDVASAVVGRLLRAAREKGLMAVRVGVAMFAASTESPEAVLERALMNARRGSV